jgi:hypothetical protein
MPVDVAWFRGTRLDLVVCPRVLAVRCGVREHPDDARHPKQLASTAATRLLGPELGHLTELLFDANQFGERTSVPPIVEKMPLSAFMALSDLTTLLEAQMPVELSNGHHGSGALWLCPVYAFPRSFIMSVGIGWQHAIISHAGPKGEFQVRLGLLGALRLRTTLTRWSYPLESRRRRTRS